ncbi:MAG: coproporphyrinogen dehydrogenase HemZ [Bacillota bacterium]|nr:coproporphyrinogen dehydrogenase HemZ [Bacillota bacterium]
MYNIDLNRAENHYELTELVRMFLPPSQYRVVEGTEVREEDGPLIRIPEGLTDKNEAKRYLYRTLREALGTGPDWGVLTGVRPVRLAGDYLRAGHSLEETGTYLREYFYLTEERAGLVLDVLALQLEVAGTPPPGGVGLYIGIPFCPSRCLYCSFTSNQVKQPQIDAYLEALFREIAFAGEEMGRLGWYPESVYIGGGTPTTLSAAELERLLRHVRQLLPMENCREFTVEAGRPDTITEEKLRVMTEQGVGRSCVNPQSMKAETLERIGRRHGPREVREALLLMKQAEMPVVNADLIAGLPEETPEDFLASLEEMIALGPENITVHTLAVKRASRLKELDGEYSYRQEERTRAMLDGGRKLLKKAGYRPYYLYRQKQSAGNFENVGYALPGTESLYNIRIMEENQSIVALGAGGVSKLWHPAENRLERIPNVSNYEIYIRNIEEMMERKRKGLFIRRK